ncbi:MAG: thiamine/thiamine pyrophosphate ABC transporter permease ThiP [Parvibaculaceae bacterium]
MTFSLANGSKLAAGAALAAIMLAVAAGLVPVAAIGIGEGFVIGHVVDAYVLRILWFTLLQAGLSTLLSVMLALPVALALARADFWGRGLLLRLFALPLALPAIVVILGIVAVYGRTGWLSQLLGHPLDIYGLTGILLAHVFFNLPLAARLILQQLEGIAPESFRLAAQLGFTDMARFRLIEWPQVRGSLAGIASLIFLICAASFAVVLTLGGGPSATTLEVGIYQALRFDYDPARATVLSLVQLVLCGLFVLLAGQYAHAVQSWPALRRKVHRHETRSAAASLALGLIIALAAVFVGVPVLAIVVTGALAQFDWPALVRATLTSLLIAVPAAGLSILLAWPIAQASARARSRSWRSLLDLSALLTLIVPPAVLATGWFIAATRLGLAFTAAPFLVIAMNALMALPFALGTLSPSVQQAMAQHDRLCASLGIGGLRRLLLIDLPVLSRPLGLAAAMAFVLSLGDLTAITLFGSQSLMTLPALIYAQMGSYRIDAASGSALVLALFSMAVITLLDKWSARA